MATVAIHLQRLRRRAARRRVNAESFLAAEFEREALGAERLRVLVLTIVIGAGLSLSLIGPAFISEEVRHSLRGSIQAFGQWRFNVLLAMVVYLVAERVVLNRFVKSGRRIPAFYRYVTAFVETSCPTAEIMVAAAYAGGVTSLSLLPVFVYPFFIVLSALRLNFRLSVFTGAVAALEYTLVGIAYINGGGFAGVYTARYLEKALGRRDDFEIVLVNKENYFVFQPMLAELGPGEYFGETAVLNNTTRNATVRCVEALDVVSLPKREFMLVTSNLPDARRRFEEVAGQRARSTALRLEQAAP
jgi:hypothetical protein